MGRRIHVRCASVLLKVSDTCGGSIFSLLTCVPFSRTSLQGVPSTAEIRTTDLPPVLSTESIRQPSRTRTPFPPPTFAHSERASRLAESIDPPPLLF